MDEDERYDEEPDNEELYREVNDILREAELRG